MINPYNNVNWSTYLKVPSCSHEHDKSQPAFNKLVSGGLKHIALSNYHPPEPWYPLDSKFTIPTGAEVIGSPNAEFYSMSIASLHANGLGSLYYEGEPAPTATWKSKFLNILNHMQYSDAGGITINHPAWTKWAGAGSANILTNKAIMEMLDFDNRVLGIEFFNTTCGKIVDSDWSLFDTTGKSWDLDTWDDILKTGRRCWGFCVADHDGEILTDGYNWIGRNILLCDSSIMNTGTTAEKEHECLKAYREGRFYGSLKDTNLKFTEISINGNTLTVSATDATSLHIVVDGVYNTINSNSTTYTIPNYATYVRVEGHNDEDRIFSNPIIFKPFTKEDSTAKKMLLIG